MEITLEQEFAENLQMHKWAILVDKISRFHRDCFISSGEFTDNDEIDRKSRMMARDEVRNLLLNNKEEFDRLYALAWEEVKDEIE